LMYGHKSDVSKMNMAKAWEPAFHSCETDVTMLTVRMTFSSKILPSVSSIICVLAVTPDETSATTRSVKFATMKIGIP
jgi:hypothetical protein